VIAICVAAAVLPLPLGFVDEAVALVAGFWGLYYVLPMLAFAGAAAAAVRTNLWRVSIRCGVVVAVSVATLCWAYCGAVARTCRPRRPGALGVVTVIATRLWQV
jgi:hypothetical protein